MDKIMIRDAVPALAARLKELLDQRMEREIRITREDAVLALGFAESVAVLVGAPS